MSNLLRVKHLFCAALLVIAGLFFSSGATAQLRVAVSAERSHFLLFEPANFDLQLTNETAEPMELFNSVDGKSTWLAFNILRPNNTRVRPDIPFEPADRVIQPGETVGLRINITPYYAIRETGEYRIQVVIRQPGQLPVMTRPLTFTVGRGERFWSENRLMPDGSTRTYSLIRFLYEQSLNPNLYLQVEDEGNNVVYATIRLGPIVAREVPKTIFAPDGSFHVLWSTAPKTYVYTATDDRGKVLRQVERMSGVSVPDLAMGPAGTVSLVGGASRQESERAKLSQSQGVVPGAEVTVRPPAAGYPMPTRPSDAPGAPTSRDLRQR